MQKIIIFGNSGSGKSTLAKHYADKFDITHLDLDTLAWEKSVPPKRAPLLQSTQDINAFTSKHQNWVVEGCYADLLESMAQHADHMIFMNLSVKACIQNCKNRPWEPHKYASQKAQDQNLDMLTDWVSQYAFRTNEVSFQAHRKLFENFKGNKTEITENRKLADH